MPSVSETAARIRAAHYYANLRQDDLAEALGVGVSTVARIEAGRKEATREQVEIIAALCKVPMEFMQTGFELIAQHGRGKTPADVVGRVSDLETGIRSLQEGQEEAVVREMEVQARLSALETAIRHLQPPKRP